MKHIAIAFAAAVLFAACTTPAVPPASLSELTGNMQRARSSVQRFSADARITYFGKEGRARGSATFVVARPASLRYELHGPHGGVIQAFATNGKELQLIDFKENHFIYGPSTPETIDRLIQFAPLHLSAEAWVEMLFGDVVIAPGAEVAAEKQYWLARWTERGVTREVRVDPKTARLARLRALQGTSVLSDVEVTDYDAAGLPTELHMRVPLQEVDLTIRLSDLTIDPELDSGVFVLDPPSAMTPERIEP